MDREQNITLHEVYPTFSEEQLAEAENTFRKYIAVMVRIYERVRAEQGPEDATLLAYGDLTPSEGSDTVPVERSNTTPTK
jgi:hypothetical protein